jgi:antitoxin component YwqK of YwqJK toxin-antitoxin module
MNTLKRTSLLLTLTFFVGLYGFGQEVDTITINGEELFVYPFKIEPQQSSAYFASIKRERYGALITYTAYSKNYDDYFGPKLSRKEFNRIMRKSSFNRRQGFGKKSDYSRKFIKAVRSNPYPLLEMEYEMDVDVVPVLDPIPDGQYVQLFEPFCLVDAKGDCNYSEELIAGYFSIKDNTLHGNAYWLNIHGDTLKAGEFNMGLKVGKWKLETRSLGYTLEEYEVEQYEDLGYIDLDTTIIYQDFVDGAETGSYERYFDSEYPTEAGHYQDGERVGKWDYRRINYVWEEDVKMRLRSNDVVTTSYELANEKVDTLVVKSPWIRTNLIRPYRYDDFEFNFMSEYDVPSLPEYMYRMNVDVEENLELDEEEYNSYGSDEFTELDMIEPAMERIDWEGSGYSSGYGSNIYDPNLDRYVSRGKMIDSIGMIARYKGEYVKRYPNGQIAYKYEFKDGVHLLEDTLFWDNGIEHDVITFIPDSNHYQRSIYDYTGKLYQRIIYDSLGDYYRMDYEFKQDNTVWIDGLRATYNDYSEFYTYDAYDTLSFELTEPLTLYRSWHVLDSSMLYNAQYYPAERIVKRLNLSIKGDSAIVGERTFAEDFSSWTGSNKNKIGELELNTTYSGALYDFDADEDTIPQRHVQSSFGDYDVAEDNNLSFKGVPFTGPVSMTFSKKTFSYSKSKLNFNFQLDTEKNKRLQKQIDAYLEKGKVNDPFVLSYIDSKDGDANIGRYVFNDFFRDLLGERFTFTEGGRGDYGWEYYGNEKGRKKPAYMAKLEGNLVDGKPHGVWVGYDQYGSVMKEVPYENGDVNGTLKEYRYAEPIPEEQRMWHYMDPARDSFPEKRTYFLSESKEFKNGMQDGPSREFTWYNDIKSEFYFSEGYREGPAFERNRLAYSRMNYQRGMLDGYVQTYLTLPKRDSILLFDLNFQDGNLQGESKSYHTNGKLSKRGFFLNGEPIEDYEAYDSLGFRYHYVKFEYGFPVEEKVWEENELSVRYLFNWEDSIYFEPVDITSSESLDRLIADLGLGGYGLQMPYYGRPTLVNKRGVKFHMTKYYPNDTIARDGDLNRGRKIGCWKYYDYEGEMLYEVDYEDSIIVLNDSIKFKSKGVISDFDAEGNLLYEAFVIEKFEKYDCSHTDHYEIRQLYTIWEAYDSLGRMNGYVQNFYDNGEIQSEGNMKDGLPTGVWKFYDPFGKLNKVGEYVMGKRNGRWLSGDLSKTKYLGDICLNPNLPDLEEEIRYRENLLDITITNYKLGKTLNSQYYDVDMNQFIETDEDEEAEAVEEIEE